MLNKITKAFMDDVDIHKNSQASLNVIYMIHWVLAVSRCFASTFSRMSYFGDSLYLTS